MKSFNLFYIITSIVGIGSIQAHVQSDEIQYEQTNIELTTNIGYKATLTEDTFSLD